MSAWDTIIIGAGSAGCALTHQLIEAGRKVLVLEAGGRDTSPFIRIAAGQAQATARHDWGYFTEADQSRNGRVDLWTRGRVLGGCSSVNGTMFVRGAPSDFDRWSNLGWAASDVMPIFQAMERSDQSGATRGRDGQLHVRTVKRPHPVSRAFVASATAAGHLFNPDYNDGLQDGVSYAQLSQRRGWRCSAADAFLKPHIGSRNLTLICNAHVEQIETNKGSAVAVRYRVSGKAQRASADRIVLSAGAINSPKLLMLSGIGSETELARHGIRVVKHLPGVGTNLMEHTSVHLTYRSKIPTNNPTEGIVQKAKALLEFVAHGEGALSNLFEATAFIRSSPERSSPNLQLLFVPFGFLKDEAGKPQLVQSPAFSILVVNSYPESRGRVALRSSDSDAPPLIDCPLLASQADVDALVQGIHAVRDITSQPLLADLIDEELMPGGHAAGDAALEQFVRATSGIAFHPIGTCRMGVDADAVVGPDLRVPGFENLYVADASILPQHISANINAACMMIGTKLGKQLAAS